MSAEGGDIVEIPGSEDWGEIMAAEASPADDTIIYVEQLEESVELRATDIDGATPEIVYSFSKETNFPSSAIAGSFDGSMIACAISYPSRLVNLFLIPMAGGDPLMLTEFSDTSPVPYSPTWSADGKIMTIETLLPNELHSLYRVELKLH